VVILLSVSTLLNFVKVIREHFIQCWRGECHAIAEIELLSVRKMNVGCGGFGGLAATSRTGNNACSSDLPIDTEKLKKDWRRVHTEGLWKVKERE
jgi:hypothetical protein